MRGGHRWALVTGASGGVGGAVTRRLAADGLNVLATGRRRWALEEETGTRVGRERPGKIVSCPADLSSPGGRRTLHRECRRRVGGLDVLVLSHGIFARGWEGEGDDDPQRVVDANFTSRVLVFRELLPHLRRGSGQLFVVNSTAALDRRADAPVYASSMAGCASFFRSVAGAAGVHGEVRVCTLFLGRTATPMQEEAARLEGRPYRPEKLLQPADVAGFIAERIRGPRTEDLSEVVLRPTACPTPEEAR